PNFAIWLFKNQLDEFFAEGRFGKSRFRLLKRLGHEISNGQNFLGGYMRRFLDRFEHVKEPAFPLAAFSDRTQTPIVLRFVFDDKSAEEQNRDFQKLIHD